MPDTIDNLDLTGDNDTPERRMRQNIYSAWLFRRSHLKFPTRRDVLLRGVPMARLSTPEDKAACRDWIKANGQRNSLVMLAKYR